MSVKTSRFDNIDILRGVVMVLMCIDHTIHYTLFSASDPMLLEETSGWIYLFRILSHTNAPAFIFCAGLSIGISGAKRSNKGEMSRFLLLRGALLCLLECTLVSWGWSFNPLYNVIYLQVIWAIGLSMILMAGVIYLRRWMILTISIAILSLHNLFQGVAFPQDSIMHYLWSFLLQRNMLTVCGDFSLYVLYPVLTTFAIMAFGYWMSTSYTNKESADRRRILWYVTAIMVVIFLSTRLLGYGDPKPLEWDNFALSLINVTKYPFSLNFTTLYLSFTTAFLAITEGRSFSKENFLGVIGRSPMIFYILHVYIIHAIVLGYILVLGYPLDLTTTQGGIPANFGIPLWWIAWVVPLTVAVLIGVCRKFYALKRGGKYRWTRYI